MRRHGNLWNRLTGYGNLYRAAMKAAFGKRNSARVGRFLFDLEHELCQLQDELRSREYRPGPYTTFEIYEPKRRLISASPFRDRVVHHALCRVVEPIFEATFIHDSYACRRRKGTHAALDRFTYFARRHKYVLKCDVSKFFPSVDHGILKSLLARKIKDPHVLWLADRIIDGANRQESVWEWYPGDDLLTPAERHRGLPIGNQTSQFFANVYLNPLDHFVKEQLRVQGYLRYVDDFVLFGDDPVELAEMRRRCREFLATLRLRMHAKKCAISRVKDGTRFLGFRVFSDHRLLPRENLVRLRRRIRRLQGSYAVGTLSAREVWQYLAAWQGHACHADSYRLRERLLATTIFQRRPD